MLEIKEKINKAVFPPSAALARLACNKYSENIDWWGEGEG